MIEFKKKKVGISLLLTIVTAGIYGIYWMYVLVSNTRAINKKSGAIGELLCILLIPFYALYWWYSRGNDVGWYFTENRRYSSSNGPMFFVLSLVGLSIIPMCLMQKDFNSFDSEKGTGNKESGSLEIKDVVKVFNANTVNEKVALNGLSLTLEKGDFVTVIGGNGAGKSTMLNAIAGTFPIDEGNIIIDGEDITKLPEHKRAKFIGRVFQDPMTGTAADMWIEENMAIAVRRGRSRGIQWTINDADRVMYRDLLATLDLGLEDRLSTKVGLLSGGQRQAITLLMAAMNKPKLLLLDEHTAALDPKTAAKVLDITERIVEESKLTTIMITHNMRDAIRLGNRLIMMHEGKIIYEASGEEKKKLEVADLMALFSKASSGQFANDRMLLS